MYGSWGEDTTPSEEGVSRDRQQSVWSRCCWRNGCAGKAETDNYFERSFFFALHITDVKKISFERTSVVSCQKPSLINVHYLPCIFLSNRNIVRWLEMYESK